MEPTLIGGVSTYNEAEDKSLDYDEKLDEGGNKLESWIDEQAQLPMRIAIVGRPNMGKSTLINSLFRFFD